MFRLKLRAAIFPNMYNRPTSVGTENPEIKVNLSPRR